MTRARYWILGCALLSGCAHAVQPNSPAPHVASSVAKSKALVPIFELPALGLRVRAPGPPELVEAELRVSDGPLHAQGVQCSVDSQEYSLMRYFRGGRDRAKDEDVLLGAKKGLKSVSREAPSPLGEWAGIELEGTSESGHPALMRLYVVGDGFWIARVERVAGALDRDSARAFLDSVELSQPWSVHAFPEGHFSALLPDGGVRLDKKMLQAEGFAVAEGSWLGGHEERVFAAWDMPLGSGEATPDERMDAGLEALMNDGNRVIWQAPLVVDGARGRDFLVQGKSNWMRLRLIITATELYMLQATARTKEALQDDSVPRFLDSLRWY